jgi:hypothetical protein
MEIGWLFRVFACVGRLRCGFTPSKIKQAFSSEIFSKVNREGRVKGLIASRGEAA